MNKGTVVSGIQLINRNDAFQCRLANFKISILSFADQELWSESRVLHAPIHYFFPPDVKGGKGIRIRLLDAGILHFSFLGIKSSVPEKESSKEEESPKSSDSPKRPENTKKCPKCLGLGGFDTFRPCLPSSANYKTLCPTCYGITFIQQDWEPCQTCFGKGGIGAFGPCDVVPQSIHFQKKCETCSGICYLSETKRIENEAKIQKEKKAEEQRREEERAKVIRP